MRILATNLAIYGSAHAAVDAACAAILFSFVATQGIPAAQFFTIVVVYNFLAFGSQAVLGMASDKWHIPRSLAVLGCATTAIAAMAAGYLPLAAAVLAGIGNAMFHVGGGSISLNITPKKATAPGVFVAPGAFGLLAGTLIGASGIFVGWHFSLMLLFFCLFMLRTEHPRIDYDTHKRPALSRFELIIVLLFITIAIRSLVGYLTVFPWKSDMTLLISLTAAVVLGKAAGGVLADRFGWKRIAVSALIISAPLMSLGGGIPFMAITGMFLFNMTMPVTLVAISNSLPGRPGFSFGLTCLALIAGSFIALTEMKAFLVDRWIVIGIVMLSAVILFVGLTYLFKEIPQKMPPIFKKR
jgi:FSR family fosmidomycin resistance protein-like MFS transporter